ncbi:F-box/kelch-repeat protein [Trifolium medium]|uniref:F-box/kelch-repeat protein n=1 Tax=Trifolium medium TaxID=97028 RepID=A0A392PCZ5_9FABA|nr:F-box/kelch-repeat protein [Trifolium medium]
MEWPQAAIQTSPSLQAPPPLPTLSFDLIEEILCRLPVKLLLQLRCLNKFFNSLISDPKFAKKHLRLSTKRHRLMISSRTSIGGEFVLSDSPIASDFSTSTLAPTQLSYPNYIKFEYCDTRSCDGIFCLTMNSGGYAVLWNPSLGKFKSLPPLDSKPPLATYTFGFDKLVRNYKDTRLSIFLL